MKIANYPKTQKQPQLGFRYIIFLSQHESLETLKFHIIFSHPLNNTVLFFEPLSCIIKFSSELQCYKVTTKIRLSILLLLCQRQKL